MKGLRLAIASLQCFCAIAEFNYEVGLRVRERVAEFLGKVSETMRKTLYLKIIRH